MRTAARWLPPAAVSVLIGGTALAGTLSAGASVDLPERTPAEVLVLAQQAEVAALSGTVEVSADLGLPPMLTGGDGRHADPGMVPGPAGEALGVLSGDTTLRLWADGPDRLRVQVLDDLAETDVVRNGREVWAYSSRSDTASHVRLPETDDAAAHEDDHPALAPQELADRVLAAVDPSTAVRVDDAVRVAGRDAYELLLEPRAPESLVRRVALAVDAETGLALRVRVDASSGDEPAFLAGFTELSLDAPDPAVFEFTPPPGAAVEELDPGSADHGVPDTDRPDGTGPAPQVLGQGWAAVLVLPGAPEQEQLVDLAFVPVEGGRLLATRLVSVLVTDDGRTLVGAVTPEALRAAAAS